MRGSLALLVLVRVAAAEPVLRHEDVELARPELAALAATSYEQRGGAFVEAGRELRTYDAAGHVMRQEYRKDGKVIAAFDFTWDAQGRLASRKTRDGAGALVARTFSYTNDATGRIATRVMRDPAAPAGEYFRTVTTWAPDGSRTVVTSRHVPNEGPYVFTTEVFDAGGRLARSCLEHGGCSLYEYDAHDNLDRVRQQPHGGEHHYLDYENAYDSNGRLVKRRVGGTITSYRTNARGDVVETLASSPGSPARKTVYAYTYR